MSIKQEMIKALQNLPEEATPEEAEYYVYAALLLHKRLVNTDRSQNLSLEEVRQRLKLWSE